MPLVSVVIAAHGDGKDLPVMLGSLARQREYLPGSCSRTGATVLYCAGPPCKLPIETIVCWDGDMPNPRARPWALIDTPAFEIVECSKEGGVGHHTRGPGIARASGDWIVLTNADNYFVQGWRHRIERLIQDSRNGLVYWNVLNNLWRWGTNDGTQLKRGHADLTCCAVRREIAKEVGFPFRNYDGDFDYIAECARICRRNKQRMAAIRETLAVHN